MAAFMAGLAVGAWVVNRIRPRACLKIRREAFSGTGVPPVDFVQTSGQTGETPIPHDKLKSCRWLACLSFAVSGLAALIPAVLQYDGNLPVIVAVTFALATLVGMEFPVASQAEADGGAATAGRLYAADLVGACLGAWLASTLLIPLLGVTLVCALTAVLNAVAGVVVWRRKG